MAFPPFSDVTKDDMLVAADLLDEHGFTNVADMLRLSSSLDFDCEWDVGHDLKSDTIEIACCTNRGKLKETIKNRDLILQAGPPEAFAVFEKAIYGLVKKSMLNFGYQTTALKIAAAVARLMPGR